MIRVIIESPYAGDVEANIAYARQCVRDSVMRDEAPIASHLLFTQPGILNDDDPEERMRGLVCGWLWIDVANLMAVYTDRGISEEMKSAVGLANRFNLKVEYRTLL